MSNRGLFDLSGKVAIVVGGASGIGEAVTIGAVAQGARVVCLDVKADEAAKLAKRATAEAGVDASMCEAGTLDIRDGAAVKASFADVHARLGSLDIVICTPSINVRKPILKYTEEELQRVLDLNIKGNFNVLQSAGAIMTEQKRGSIVLFSSVRSQVVEPGQGVYASTKAGILQLAKTAAAEFGPYGVRVNCVGPGVIETPLTQPIKANESWYNAYAAKSVFNRWGRADEMVGPTLFLASDAASFVTGTIVFADGGWLAADGRFTPPGM
jgi:NAD(P)-dependent dehydrogenase (short-subunit alcohol dehydrogenase family)